MNTQQLKELALIWSRSEVACMPIEEFSDLTGTPLEDVRVLFGAANVLDDLIDQLESAERERDDLKENQTRALQLVARRERQVLRYQKEIARRDALALGAQQQKVVELPEPVKWPEIPFKYFSEEQVFSMLDSAGVKWEVKK